MTKKTATYDIVSFKALTDDQGQDIGRFSASFSVFGNVDLQGDRVIPGAFDKTIRDLRITGDPVPVVWTHDWGNPFAFIGESSPHDIVADEKSVTAIGQVDLADPFAAKVYDLMKRRLVKQFSFSYEIAPDGDHTAADGAHNLTEVKLIEWGPTLMGANPQTELLGVKADLERAAHKVVSSTAVGGSAAAPQVVLTPTGLKSGRVLSKKNETKIRGALEALQEVLATLGEEVSDEKSTGRTNSAGEAVLALETKTEEPTGAKVEESQDDELLRISAELAALELPV